MKKFTNTDILYVICENRLIIDHIKEILPPFAHDKFWEFYIANPEKTRKAWYIEEQYLYKDSCSSGGAIFATNLESLKKFISTFDCDISILLDILYKYENPESIN